MSEKDEMLVVRGEGYGFVDLPRSQMRKKNMVQK